MELQQKTQSAFIIMANKFKKVKKNPQPEQKQDQLVVNELNVMSADRSRKDISDFKNALQSAESVWNPNRVQLFNLYEDVMLDGHLSGIISKRFDAVLNKSIYFEKDGKRDDQFDDLIESEEFREVVRKLMETQGWGLSGIEFVPGEKFCFKEIPRKHIKPEFGKITFEQHGEEGILYADLTNVWVMGKEKDLGYLLKCSPYALYKRGNYGDWAQYVEIFGQPVRVIYYDSYDTKTKMELRQVLDEAGSSLALMIPKQATFEMKDGKQSNGDGQLQERFKIALDSEMSIIVLGNTETTASSKSSGYAQSAEHGKQQMEITKSDLKYVRSMLNSDKFLSILQSYGYNVEGGKFKFEKEIDLGTLKTRMEIDEKLSAKVPISDDYWYDNYGVPKPDNYEELKAQKEEERQARLNSPTPDNEDDQQENEAGKKAGKTADKADKKPLKKGLISRGLWFNLRAALADFFDQPR